jgi:hypothetical protein
LRNAPDTREFLEDRLRVINTKFLAYAQKYGSDLSWSRGGGIDAGCRLV